MDKIDWRWLNTNGKHLTEERLELLLNDEVAVHKRARFVKRLHQRLAALRTARERADLLKTIIDT